MTKQHAISTENHRQCKAAINAYHKRKPYYANGSVCHIKSITPQEGRLLLELEEICNEL